MLNLVALQFYASVVFAVILMFMLPWSCNKRSALHELILHDLFATFASTGAYPLPPPPLTRFWIVLGNVWHFQIQQTDRYLRRIETIESMWFLSTRAMYLLRHIPWWVEFVHLVASAHSRRRQYATVDKFLGSISTQWRLLFISQVWFRNIVGAVVHNYSIGV